MCRNSLVGTELPDTHFMLAQWLTHTNSRSSRFQLCRKILQGSAIETVYEKAPNGTVCATGSNELTAGSICGSQDDDMHQIAKLTMPT